jgi:type IV pilus assembly protein PilW
MKMSRPNYRIEAMRSNSQRGFTLVEMMIAITIGLAIIAALVGVLASSSGNSRTNDRTSELMTNGRYALDSMKQEVRQAGFRGYTWADPTAPGSLGTLSNECLETGAPAGSFISNIRQGIWGANNRNPFSANCIPTASYATGNDILVVRRLAPVAATTLNSNTVYFRSNYAAGQIFRGTGTACPNLPASAFGSPFNTTPCINVRAAPPTDLNDFAVHIFVYYISPFTDSATESPLVPALFRVSLQSDGSMARELVATGIERMQVQYGLVTTVPDTQYLDSLSATSFDASDTTWPQVNSVRIWLLARSATPEPGYVNANSYVMGDQPAFVPSDGYRRQLFSTVIQHRN